jgi:hypothetical protein
MTRRPAGLALLLLALAAAPAAHADSEPAAVKAAFVFNFIKLVSWPEPRLPGGAAPLQVCVLKGDEMEAPLRQALAGKVVGSHPIQVTALTAEQNPAPCHVLYLGGRGGARNAALMARAAGQGVLLVDEGERFTWPNGMIRLFEEQNRMRFEINLQALERSGLKVDPRLIRLARIAAP